MDFTYISNNKTADKDIRYNIPGHFSIATFYTFYDMSFKSYFFRMAFGGHLGICKLQELPKGAIWATKLNLFHEPMLIQSNNKSS